MPDQACEVKAATPHDQEAAFLEAEIEELHYAINGLEATLTAALGAEDGNVPSKPEEIDCYGSSPISARVRDQRDRVAAAGRRLRSIQRRLEV